MVDTLLNVLSYVGLVLLVIGVIVFVAWRGARRDRAWPVAAESLGMQYNHRDDTPFNVFVGFKVFDASGVRSLANVVTGTYSSARVWLADYRYSNWPNTSSERYGFTVCMLQCGRLKVPHFRLNSRSTPRSLTPAPILRRPEDDPEVQLDGEFARTFILEAKSIDDFRPFFGPGLRERIEAIWRPYIEIEGFGDRLVVTRRSWIEPADLRQLLDLAIGILDELLRAKWS